MTSENTQRETQQETQRTRTYSIHPGLSTMVHVIDPTQKDPHTLLYKGRGMVTVYKNRYMEPIQALDIPEAVKVAVKDHFLTVFSLPEEERGVYIRTMEPIHVQVNVNVSVQF